jgi:hypothetical protein
MTVAGGNPAALGVIGAGWMLEGAGAGSDKIDAKDLVTGQQAFSDYQKEKPIRTSRSAPVFENLSIRGRAAGDDAL